MHPEIAAVENRDGQPPGGMATPPFRCLSLCLRLAALASVKERGSGTNSKPSSQRENEITMMHIEENI
jgi:hypothetical protein